MNLRLYDAHNHLQDDRFGGRQEDLLAACRQLGVARMVVNGSCESDWPQVRGLAQQHPEVLPSFGYHPWYLHERTPDWLDNLARLLDAVPGAVGEIGLDRWKPELPYEGQEDAFVAQLRLGAERDLPVSIHCLQAWGRLLALLKSEPRPARGVLLHSYGGPKEMVEPFTNLGAYFSLPGYYAHERKARQREAFKSVPPDRLLIETDAPDQLLPAPNQVETGGWNWPRRAEVYELTEAVTGKPLNHPANLPAVYAFAAELFGESVKALAARVEENFLRFFGRHR